MCTSSVVTLLTIASLIFSSTKSFAPQTFQVPTTTTSSTSFILSAKNRDKHKNKKRTRRAGRRGKIITNNDDEIDEDNKESSSSSNTFLPEPSKIRERMIQLHRTGTTDVIFPTTLSVCTVEVDDVEWWEHPDNHNPYGGRLWPSALAISEFLIAQGNLSGYHILELGCGAGLVSIVAAECGAQVIASDISPIVLKLCNIGWLQTQKKRQKQTKKRQQQQQHNKESTTQTEEQSTNIIPGSLRTSIFDLFSKNTLPLSNSSSNQNILIATTMMYQASLAKGLAQRAFEACMSGAWVIIGDDDTGQRDGGRQIFLSEFDRFNKEKGTNFQIISTNSVVKSKELQWNEKHVKILHINAPIDILSSDAAKTI